MKKCISALTLLSLLCALCIEASAAGMVTDTLTVKVGYWGMDTSTYVEVGTYHWSELEENLPLHRQAYSFFRPDADGEYRIAIDSAYGFYLADLLSYANVEQSDVLSLQFYTQDQTVGYFTSFTAQELFETNRYYYEDLAAHIRPVDGGDGTAGSWDASEAWAYCRAVPPMLALEDSWVWYDVGTEHTAPNYETLGTGNRFRLLFGQASPLETRTNQTAKYTHTVYVTLQGKPEFGTMPEPDAAIGSHDVDVTMTIGNESILKALPELLQISSSDENVLKIAAVAVVPDAEYSDLAHIRISYEILCEGRADIAFALGGGTVGSPVTLSAAAAVTPAAEPPQPAAPTQEPEAPAERPDAPGESDPPAEEPTEPAAEREDAPTPQEEPQTAIVLDAATAARLNSLRASPSAVSEPPEAASRPVDQLKLPEYRDTEAAAWTAAAAVLLMLSGGLSALLNFKRER